MARAVRSPPFDPVLPALDRAIDDRRRLSVAERCRQSLGGQDLPEVAPVLDLDHVPVVQEEQLRRRPLDVVAGLAVLATHAVRVDRGLVPVHVEEHVVERRRARGRQRLGHPAGGQPALALDHVHARRACAVEVACRERQADRARDADARRAGREAHERGRRRGMAVQRLGAELQEERGRGRRVAAEAEQVLEAQALAQVGGQAAPAGRCAPPRRAAPTSSRDPSPCDRPRTTGRPRPRDRGSPGRSPSHRTADPRRSGRTRSSRRDGPRAGRSCRAARTAIGSRGRRPRTARARPPRRREGPPPAGPSATRPAACQTRSPYLPPPVFGLAAHDPTHSQAGGYGRE